MKKTKIKTAFFTLCIFITSSIFTISASADNTSFSGGSGTEDDPFIVSSSSDFLNISSNLDCHFIQIGDISLENTECSPLGTADDPFTGEYNGNGFTISDATLESNNTEYIGLFGYSRGILTNIILEKCSIDGYSATNTVYGGALVGYNSGTISNCSVSANVLLNVKYEKTNTYCGGICGYSTSQIVNCTFSGTATSKTSYISSSAYCGGICGYGFAKDCTNSGTILAQASSSSNAYAGGISGCARSTIKNCKNTGTISAINAAIPYAGGIVGDGYGIIGCYNSGTIFAESKYAHPSISLWNDAFSGGISGYNRGTISYCENVGDVHADNSTDNELAIAGGIAGFNASTIEDSCNSGYIYTETTEKDDRIGGIAGCSYSNSFIKRCCNTGTIIGEENAIALSGHFGGIVGILQYGTVMQCCNHGPVAVMSIDSTSCIGGITGDNSGTIIDCSNSGPVTIDMQTIDSWRAGYCGGICGHNSANISYCYNIGLLTSKTVYAKVGGITGNCSEKIEHCYALDLYLDTFATQMTEENAKKQETYIDFDFDNVWAIKEDYPYLITLPTNDNSNWYTDPDHIISVSGVFLNNSTLTLSVGDTNNLIATALPGNASNPSFEWESNAPEIATVTTSGKVTAIAPGTAIITVTTDDGGYTATCTVTVTERAAEEYRINSIVLHNENGETLTSIPSSTSLATVSVTNLASQGDTLIFLAAYTDGGPYQGLMWASITDLPEGATIQITLPVNNSSGKITKLKAFTIASFNNPIPLGNSVSF